MQKGLCIIALTISAIVFLLFLADLIIGMPFQSANRPLDITFIICAAIVGILSWFTYREQV